MEAMESEMDVMRQIETGGVAGSYYTIRPEGGCAWTVYLVDEDDDREFCGTVHAGEIDDEGQWQGEEDEVFEAAEHLLTTDDPVYVDGVKIR